MCNKQIKFNFKLLKFVATLNIKAVVQKSHIKMIFSSIIYSLFPFKELYTNEFKTKN